LDESHIRDVQTIHSTWQEKGKQQQVKVVGKLTTLSLFGCANALTGEFFCMETKTCNAQTFEQFLSYLLDQNPEKHLVIVLDNARYHHARRLRPFLKRNEDRLTFYFLPPYSPNLNLIERIWGWLKDTVVANAFYKTQERLVQQIEQFLEKMAQSPDDVLSRLGQPHMLIT
jgi:transposase